MRNTVPVFLYVFFALALCGLAALAVLYNRLLKQRDPARSALIDLLPQMLMVLDENGRIIDANPAARKMLDIEMPLGKQKCDQVLDAWLDRRGGERLVLEDEHYLFVSDGERKVCYQLTKHQLESGGVHQGFAVVISDVTSMHKMLETLRTQANHDTLTGLPNRRAFDEKTRQMVRQGQYPFAVVLVDLDHLKRINDTCGHAEGDKALSFVATVLAQHAPPQGIAARIGGDEFAMVVPDIDQMAADTLCEKMLAEIHQLMLPYGAPLSASFGAAVMRSGEQLFIDVYETADKRMYVQKLLHHAVREV